MTINTNKEDEDRSRLYWSCHFHKQTVVCDFLCQNYELLRKANEAIENLFEITKIAGKQEIDFSQNSLPFPLPTSPDFIVKELRDDSIISFKSKPFKFTVVDQHGKKN